MPPGPPFHAFGAAHLTIILLTIGLPLALAALVQRTKSHRIERTVVVSLSATLILNYIVFLVLCRESGPMNWEQTLPLQLCDWGMVVVIVAMLSENQRWFEVAYFWGLGGTLQAVLTPNLRFGFPDFHFICFFVSHSAIIVGVVFLMLVRGYRPYPMSFVRTFAWTELYFVITSVVDTFTGYNYGFLLHKPEAFSILSFLSDWRPLYLLQLHGLALLFFGVLYLPFLPADLVRRKSAL